MTSSDWRPIGKHDPAKLGKARLHAHYAVQWLARAARAYVPPQPDDSHTNLGWDDALDGFTTHALKGGARVGIADFRPDADDAGRAEGRFPAQRPHGRGGARLAWRANKCARPGCRRRSMRPRPTLSTQTPSPAARPMMPAAKRDALARTCGLVRQCRSLAHFNPQSDHCAQACRVARALLAAPFRPRHACFAR